MRLSPSSPGSPDHYDRLRAACGPGIVGSVPEAPQASRALRGARKWLPVAAILGLLFLAAYAMGRSEDLAPEATCALAQSHSMPCH
ncbi:Hypothetical protein RMHFA_04630 [Roseomonas mucosa]|nr:Hypothetical protein RMHFA_04630 [Roseomonas mucosa]